MKLIRYAPSVVWMGTIFYLSHQPANKSAETSLGVVDFALNIIPVPETYEKEFHAFVRKSAHFFAYAFLAMLIYYAYRGNHRIFFTLMISLLYAISDELHQLFIPGRSAEVRDVLIDVCGAAFGLLIIKLGMKILSRRD